MISGRLTFRPNRADGSRQLGASPPTLKKLSENGRNALCLKEVEAKEFSTEHRHGSRRHDPHQGPTQAVADDLGGPRRTLAADRADPQGVLAPEGHRTPRRQLEED